MSAPLLNSTFDVHLADAAAPPRRRLPPAGWLREPLLHFVVLGGLLFAIDRLVADRADDPHTIVMGAEVDQEAKSIFKANRGQDPSPEELEALRRVWLDNEILYREGLALQVDKGDTAIRERVIFKALTVIDSNVKLPPIDDKALRDWFAARRNKYDEPARYDFEEAVLSGDSSEGAVRAFVNVLNRGTPGDAKAGLRVFKGRPHANLIQSYGPEFTRALEQAPVGKWQAQKTREGWRAVRLVAVTPPKPASFDSLRGVVLQDWKDAVAAEQRTAAVRALARKYRIRREGPP